MCRPVLDAAERGVIEIVVSAIALVEVLARNRTSGVDDQRVRDFFDNDYILLVNVDKHLGDFARRLMLAGHGGLKPPDAIHLATACIANAEEFHTFDDRLLALDGVIDDWTARDWSSGSPPCQPRQRRCLTKSNEAEEDDESLDQRWPMKSIEPL